MRFEVQILNATEEVFYSIVTNKAEQAREFLLHFDEPGSTMSLVAENERNVMTMHGKVKILHALERFHTFRELFDRGYQ